MKFVVGVIIALLLFLGLAPLWGWMAAVLYGVIAWVGGLFADAPLADGRLAFRAGVMLGGLVSVGAMLRVAWKDRSHAYLIAASALAAGFLLVLVGTSLSPGQRGRNPEAGVGGRRQLPKPRPQVWRDGGHHAVPTSAMLPRVYRKSRARRHAGGRTRPM